MYSLPPISYILTLVQIRSESDEILLNHAEKEGVLVFQGTRVDALDFEGDPSVSRPISAKWSNKSGQAGTISFEWLVDASGRAGIISTKYLKNREFREHLRNVAVWGYWRDVTIYQEGTPRSNAPWFEAMTGDPSPLVYITCFSAH